MKGMGISNKVTKGTSSGVALSIAIHAGLAAAAAAIVISHIIEDPPIVMVAPPPREVTKIDLVKLMPRVDRSSPKKQSFERIAVEDQPNIEHQVAVPDLAPAKGNLGDFGVGVDFGDFQFDTKPGLIGEEISTGFDFEGTFYDFKRGRSGRPVIMDPHQFVAEVAQFVRNDWRPETFGRYYQSPKKLFAKHFMVPPVRSSVAPKAFKEDTVGYCWLAHYQGKLAHHEDITFRFWGQGDDIMAVRVDGEVVLVASWPGGTWGTQEAITSAAEGWQTSSPKSRTYTLGNNTAVVGDWITVKAGEPLDMEVIIGEVPGGMFSAMLTVEVKGEDYALNREQGPILPIFKSSELSRDAKDAIYEYLTLDHASVEGGAIFSGLPPKDPTNGVVVAEEPEVVAPAEENRPWMVNGKPMEAEYVKTIGDHVVLKAADGAWVRVPESSLVAADRERVALANPPALNMTFTKQSNQRIIKTTPYLNEIPPRIHDYVFGAKVRQTSARLYDHPLNLELYVLGRQCYDDKKFVLLDHQQQTFTFATESGRSYVMKGREVELMRYDREQPIGRAYSDYLLIARDSRGEIIQHASSANWLYPNLDKLAQLKVGDFMNDQAERVVPTGPGPRSLYY